MTEKEYMLERDIVYGTGGDVELLVNIARPSSGKGPFPALIFLHHYYSGDRTKFYLETIESAKRGYVAAAVDIRITKEKLDNGTTKYRFPAQIHDAKCAVRWLKANAGKYKIDKGRIGAIGFSAGAELALMLGLADPSGGLEGTCGNSRISTRIQAVVNIAGSTDLAKEHERGTYSHLNEALLGGAPEEVPALYKAASAINYVRPDIPPVLTICGSKDAAFNDVKAFDDKMKAVGAPHTLIVIDSAGHKLSDLLDFFQDNPAWDFFTKHLEQAQ